MLIIDCGDVNNSEKTTISWHCLSQFDSANIID